MKICIINSKKDRRWLLCQKVTQQVQKGQVQNKDQHKASHQEMEEVAVKIDHGQQDDHGPGEDEGKYYIYRTN